MLNHPTGLFSGDYNSALGGAGPSNFYTPYNSLKCISSRTWGAGRPHVGLCPIFHISSLNLFRHRISFELRRPIAVSGVAGSLAALRWSNLPPSRLRLWKLESLFKVSRTVTVSSDISILLSSTIVCWYNGFVFKCKYSSQ